MKVFYVAHKWGGDDDNARKADEVIRWLYQKHPECCFVSPIHGIRCPYAGVSYSQGLAYALALMLKCDGVIRASDMDGSSGVKAEVALAITMGIPVTDLADWRSDDD